MKKHTEKIKKKVRSLYDSHPYKMQAVSKKLALVKKIAGKKVLDAGCGAGNQLFEYLFAGADVTGIDQSQESIASIKRHLHGLPFKPTLIVGDLEQLSLPDNSFDYIFCTGVLHHTPNPEPILRSFQRVCKPQGKIRILVYHTYSFENVIRKILSVIPLHFLVPRSFKQRFEWWDKYEHPYWETYSRRRLSKLCRVAGLRVTKVSYKMLGWHLIIECTPRT